MNPTQLAAEAADSLWNDEWTDEDEKKFPRIAEEFRRAFRIERDGSYKL